MKPRGIESIVSVSIFLFFLQALRVIFSVLFGIIYDQIFEGPVDAWLVVSNLLVLLAFIAPIRGPKSNHNRWVFVFATIASLARVSLSINLAEVRFWGSLLTVAMTTSVAAAAEEMSASIREIGTKHIPFAMTVRTPRQRSETRVVTDDYELTPEIPDAIFTTWNLEAGDADRDRARAN